MKKFTLILLLGLALASVAWGQASGSITTTSTATNCPSLDASRMATVAISVTGTWTGTLTPEISVGGNAAQTTQVVPANSSTTQTSITSNNVYYAAGGGFVMVCGPTNSGTANIFLQPVPGTAFNLFGGSGGGAVSSVFGRTGAVVATNTDYSSVTNLELGNGASSFIHFNSTELNIQGHTEVVINDTATDALTLSAGSATLEDEAEDEIGVNAGSVIALDEAGDEWSMSSGASTITTTFAVHSGTHTVLRCTTAGTLPVGALTITSGDCGASSDTGLRVN
jgi:hypothetical protein